MNLYRIRATNTNTSEQEPFYIVASCRESAAEAWFIMRLRDLEEECELVVEEILSHERANP